MKREHKSAPSLRSAPRPVLAAFSLAFALLDPYAGRAIVCSALWPARQGSNLQPPA